jgi:hypothetical protein
MVNIGVATQILRLTLFAFALFANLEISPIGTLITYWLILTSLVAPAVSIYWVVYSVRGAPQKIIVAILGITIHLLFIYEMYWYYFGPVM